MISESWQLFDRAGKAIWDERSGLSPLTLDAEKGVLDVNVSEEDFHRRAKSWKPRDNGYGSGALFKYAQQVGPARFGATTHPGGEAERVSYADI